MIIHKISFSLPDSIIFTPYKKKPRISALPREDHQRPAKLLPIDLIQPLFKQLMEFKDKKFLESEFI